MHKRSVKIIASAMLCATMLSAVSFNASAIGAASVGEEYAVTANISRIGYRGEKREYSLKRIQNKSAAAYESVEVYYNSRSLGKIGKRINGEIYISMRDITESITDASVGYNSGSRTMTVMGNGYNLSVSDGAYATYADGRVFFRDTPSVLLNDGNMYVPSSSVAKAFSLSASSENSGAMRLLGTAKPALSGNRFYREDEVLWLARIISAESRGEPLIGQLAVGSVILNRVRSGDYPNTIWGVIFDRRYGVQFSPVANGTVYNNPTSTCILAAKICLEGFRASEDALFFLAPSVATSSWIENNRTYLFSIGRHDFYA